MTVSALVAAGIAVYESPQFREWVNNSRRKIALALHNLGDGIQPPQSASPLREDISMTEESGEAAQERRRVAHEEILRRGSLFEARRRKKQSSPPNSFDSLVDGDGNLRNPDLLEVSPDSAAKATGVDLSSSQPLQPEKQDDVSGPIDATDKDRLHVDIPSDSPPQPRSETLVDLTPTSEAPETAFDTPAHGTSERGKPAGLPHEASQPDLGPGPSTGSTDGENIQTYYAHPEPPSDENRGDVGSPFADVLSASPTSATAGSYSHLDELEDAASDGTLSDLGRSSGGVATPASWSEIGSVVSSDDGHHHGLQ